MARKTKTPARVARAPRARRGERAYAVVLEDLSSKFAVFGEALEGLRQTMLAEFRQVDARFEQIDRRFEQVDRRFEQIDRRFDRLESDVRLVKLAVLETNDRLRTKVDRADVVAMVEAIGERERGV